MSLPQAVASGAGADTPEAVRPLRVALGAGVLAALYLLVIYLAHPVPDRLVALFGGAHSDMERAGGLEVVWLPPPGMSADEIVQRYRMGERSALVRRDRDAFVISVPGVHRDLVDETAQRIAGEHGLEFHAVVETEAMMRLASLLGLPMKGQRPVDMDVDQWRADDATTAVTDYYLFGDTRADLDAALAEARRRGWQLPPGTRIAYEHVATTMRDGWRTYVIDEHTELGGLDIASAMPSYEPNTNRPIVLLDFTRAGAEAFAELTGRIRGHKLAIVIGDEVRSAPIIQTAIRGGRASITMGGNDPNEQQREAQLLVGTLRAGVLPAGGTIVSKRYVDPVDDLPMQWLARLAIALGGGALIALLAWMTIRVTRPVRRKRAATLEGPMPWQRLGITLLAPVAIYVVSKVTVLGISTDELLYQFGGSMFGSSYDQLREQLSFGALGIVPVIDAFVLAEVLALIVPGWRRRRHAGPLARAPIRAAVAITAATLLVLQGWFIVQYIRALGPDIMAPGAWPAIEIISSFAIGTLALVGVAALIREHGLGNGYGALIAGGWFVHVGGAWLDGPPIHTELVIGAVTGLAIAVPLAVTARWRIARMGEAPIRVPASGVAPLGEAGGLVVVVAVLSRFPLSDVTLKLYDWTIAARAQQWLLIALVAAFTLLWSLAFARPAVTRRLAERVGLTAPSWRAWWHAVALSCALLLLVGAAATFAARVRPSAASLVDAITIATIAMVLLDIHADWRRRRVPLERVWSLHQAQHVDLVARALDDAAIPHHFSSTYLKTLLAFFGPFAPVDVLVPIEHAPAARQKLAELFE